MNSGRVLKEKVEYSAVLVLSRRYFYPANTFISLIPDHSAPNTISGTVPARVEGKWMMPQGIPRGSQDLRASPDRAQIPVRTGTDKK